MDVDNMQPDSSGCYKLAAVIGQGVARVNVTGINNNKTPSQNMRLFLCNPGGVDDGAYYPAESYELYSLHQITRLRDLLNDAIRLAHKGAHEEPVAEAINQVQVATT